jgi:hypothetical protein
MILSGFKRPVKVKSFPDLNKKPELLVNCWQLLVAGCELTGNKEPATSNLS